MCAAVVVLVALLLSLGSVAAADEPMRSRERLYLPTRDVFRLLGAPQPPPPDDPFTRFFDALGRRPLGWRPLLTILPPSEDDPTPSELPTFALVAGAPGATIVSLTRPHARVDDGQRLVLQRTLVSGLFEGRTFSLTVFEDHTLSDTASRLLGVGARMTFRPTVAVAGWRLRFELIGAFSPDAGASGYLSVSGVLGAPPFLPFTEPGR